MNYKKTGCWGCKHLEFFTSYFEENSGSGWGCDFRDVEHFKTFPCVRKLGCFERQLEEVSK